MRSLQCKQRAIKSVHSNKNGENGLWLRNQFKLTGNIESIIHWLFQLIKLGLILELSGVSCKFCENGRFGLRKDSSFSTDLFQQSMWGRLPV